MRNPTEFRGILKLHQGGHMLFPRIRVADTFGLRSLGLMGRKKLPMAYGAGLFFPHCRSLHGCFMRFELEVWFMDAEGQPLGGPKRLKPWGMAVGPKGAVHCMEISPGAIGHAADGDWQWTSLF